jgi:hypothetical protein
VEVAALGGSSFPQADTTATSVRTMTIAPVRQSLGIGGYASEAVFHGRRHAARELQGQTLL